jgi:hypothetical protein
MQICKTESGENPGEAEAHLNSGDDQEVTMAMV